MDIEQPYEIVVPKICVTSFIKDGGFNNFGDVPWNVKVFLLIKVYICGEI